MASAGVLRGAITVGVWNAASRVSGFVRVLAVGAALGATFLGNTYQGSNLVSNVLFELLAAGLLSAPLVPVVVGLLASGDRVAAERLTGALLAWAGVTLAVAGLAVALCGPLIMRLLTVGVDPAVREREVALGATWLWWFAPQLFFYGVGAVATAALHADRRFAASSAAPVLNNLVVTATMVAFIVVHTGPLTLELPAGERALLGAGTTLGVLAMSALPIVAMWRSRFRPVVRLVRRDPALRPLRGLVSWAIVFVAANQVLVGASLVLAGRVEGGVVAYQIAMTFFLLPHALFTHPLATALVPTVAEATHAGAPLEAAEQVGAALRLLLGLCIPGAAALAVAAAPLLHVVSVGALSGAGAGLVSRALQAYALGLPGWAALFLLGRAHVASGDLKVPALILLVASVAGAVAMGLGSMAVEGDDRIVPLGVGTAVAVSAGAIVQLTLLGRRLGASVSVGAAGWRGLAAALLVVGCGLGARASLTGDGRVGAAVQVAAVGLGSLSALALVHAATHSPELAAARRMLVRGRGGVT